MWSRYLGQSLGAAIAGAIFNAAMLDQLAQAPEALKTSLPHVNDVVTLLQGHDASEAVHHYLQGAFDIATHQVYIGMAGVAVAALLLVFWIVPRHPRAEAKAPA
ncbi:hypothetical protein CDEF62S_02826 [Castellaniella defragrans]